VQIECPFDRDSPGIVNSQESQLPTPKTYA
jgi:hypothetical protein